MCDFRVIEYDGANDPAKCVCKDAVLNAYDGMMQAGCSTKKAVEVAWHVYRSYHPDDTKEDSRLTVERWLVSERARMALH